MIDIAIIDDEKEFLNAFADLLRDKFSKQDVETKIKIYRDIVSCCKQRIKFDYIFLDIILGKSDCFGEIGKLMELNQKVKIIFMTANNYLVYNACHYSPFDFLRKDSIYLELPNLISKIFSSHNMNEKTLTFEIDACEHNIFTNKVIYFEMQKNYLNIHIENGIVLTSRYTLKKLMNELEEQKCNEFVKIDKSTIVNTKYCINITKDNVELNNGEKLNFPLNRRNKVRNEIIKKIISSY